MTNAATQWDINKYGQLIDRSEIERVDIGIITTKLYKFQGKYYLELWDNGYCIYFSEEIG